MGFGHRVYRAEDPRARVLRETAARLGAPRFEVAAALEEAALAELHARRPDRVLATNVEFWAAVMLDFAEVPARMFTPDVHLRAHGRLVGAHPRAEGHRTADPPVGALRRPSRKRAVSEVSGWPADLTPSARVPPGGPRRSRCADAAAGLSAVTAPDIRIPTYLLPARRALRLRPEQDPGRAGRRPARRRDDPARHVAPAGAGATSSSGGCSAGLRDLFVAAGRATRSSSATAARPLFWDIATLGLVRERAQHLAVR